MKLMKRLLVFSLIFVMLTSVNVFAEDTTEPEVQTETTTGTETSTDETTTDGTNTGSETSTDGTTIEDSTSAQEVTETTTTTTKTIGKNAWLKTSESWKGDQLDTALNAYTAEIKVSTDTKNSYFKVKPQKSGFLYLYVKSDSTNKKKVTIQQLYKNGKWIRNIKTNLAPGSGTRAMIPVAKNCEYRIYMNGATANDHFYAKSALVWGSQTRNLYESTGSNYYIASGKVFGKNSYTTYWKVNMTKKGAMKINICDIWHSSPHNTKVTLLDSKKRVISETVSAKGSKSGNSYKMNLYTYGVLKGTYYVKVTTDAPLFAIKLTADGYYNNWVSNTMKKAATLTSGVTKRSVLYANRSKFAHYVKVTTKSKGDLKIGVSIMAAPNSKVVVQLLNNKGAVLKNSVQTIKGTTPTVNVGKVFTVKNASAGTYYVKIYKYNSKSSAAYEISYPSVIAEK